MAGAYFCTPQEGKHMQQTRLPEHPAAQEEYLHLQQVRDAIERESSEV